MSTDCEGILRRFLVLNPTKRCTLEVMNGKHKRYTTRLPLKNNCTDNWSVSLSSFLQQVMKDKWINTGYEGEELKPHIEPVEDYSDPARIGESAGSMLGQDVFSTKKQRMYVTFPLHSVVHSYLLVSLRGDGWDGLHTRGDQGLTAQSEIQRGHRHLPAAGPQKWCELSESFIH